MHSIHTHTHMSSSKTKEPGNNLSPALFQLITEARWKGVFLGKNLSSWNY